MITHCYLCNHPLFLVNQYINDRKLACYNNACTNSFLGIRLIIDHNDTSINFLNAPIQINHNFYSLKFDKKFFFDNQLSFLSIYKHIHQPAFIANNQVTNPLYIKKLLWQTNSTLHIPLNFLPEIENIIRKVLKLHVFSWLLPLAISASVLYVLLKRVIISTNSFAQTNLVTPLILLSIIISLHISSIL